LSLYSKDLIPKNANAQTTVITMYTRNLAKLFIFRDAQASTTVTEEVMRTAVLKVPMGMLSRPRGQPSATSGQKPTGALTLRRM
jgi:hypothetical protein